MALRAVLCFFDMFSFMSAVIGGLICVKFKTTLQIIGNEICPSVGA